MSESTDFDFLMGDWQIKNQRLGRRFQNSNEWETFMATTQVRPLPGRIGNYDDFTPLHWQPDFIGMSLRIFNPVTKLWSIYWLDNRSGGLDQTGRLHSLVIGRFTHGVGVFEGREELDGKPIGVRFLWSEITATSARWEQAMSADQGNTWETNWIMWFTRAENL